MMDEQARVDAGARWRANRGLAAAKALWRFGRAKPLGAFGGLILALMILVAVFAPALATHDPVRTNSRAMLLAPSAEYWLGTDARGRDLYSRIVYGAQTSMTVGFLATGLSLAISFIIGAISAYKVGLTDLLIQRVVDSFHSIPTLLLHLVAIVVLGQGMFTLIGLIAIASGIGGSRLMRSAVLAIRASDYILAASALGARDWWIIIRHIAPNTFAPVMVAATVMFGGVTLLEASLSFLGLGVEPPTVTWGQMLSIQGGTSGTSVMSTLTKAPWIIIVPGIPLTATVWGVNMLGDALRDTLDPRMRGAMR
jgi:peptide/nickel transport system permease protein